MPSTGFRARPAARYWLAVGGLLILAFVLFHAYAAAVEPGSERFQRTWDRTDLAVQDGLVSRTWMWGPQANVGVMLEPYGEAPGGTREVQYFDKARMEDNSFRADGAPWDVTNGLLVVELITGNLQNGDATFEQRAPATVNVAGDADDPTGPTYATFGTHLDAAPRAFGATITERVDRGANVSDDPGLAARGVTVGFVDEVTKHAIAAPFWDFMNSSGTVYEDGQFLTDQLFENPYFATGRPITEAYWANVKVAGSYRDVLMQCFERRCLTYTPGNPVGFVVEAGNVGQHYYSWRYPSGGEATPTPTEEPSPTPALNYAYADQWGDQFDPTTLFNQPTGVAISPSGDVYIVEGGSNRVQRYTSDGIYVTRWGGQGSGNAQFNNPQDIAIDADGNVYVVDQNNHRVQKFDQNGAYLSQWGTRGAEPGQFEAPQGIAISPSGLFIYVADTGNDRVQVFNTLGEPFTDYGWGSFGTADGQFNLPTDIATDEDGNVYVTDAFNHRVQKFDTFGVYLTKWGEKGTANSQFDTPQGIAVDSGGNVYVADFKNNRVQKFTSGGDYLTQWGTPGIAPGQFTNPLRLAVDAEDNVYVVELNGGQVQKFDSMGSYLDRWYDAGRGKLSDPALGLALDPSGNTYVTDHFHECLQVFDASGAWVTGIGGRCNSDLPLKEPVSATAGLDGYIYVVELKSGKIRKFTQSGEFVSEWGKDGTGNGEFDEPTGVATDADGNVYVADRNNNRIQKFTADGLYITQWGTLGNGNGEFNHPFDIAIHGERVYVVDQDNYRVQEFDRDGSYVRQWGSLGSEDGQFKRPFGIAVDQYGYVYVTDAPLADMGEHRIQKFTPDGEYLTQFGSFGSGDGQFNGPVRVEVDAAGNVFVLDSGNYRVQKFVPLP